MALAKGGPAPDTSHWPAPLDPVIWIHAGGMRDRAPIASLIDRIGLVRDDTHIVITGLDGTRPDTLGHVPVTSVVTPPESMAAIDAFLSHWTPQLCFWSGTVLHPALMHFAHERGCRLVMINADDTPIAALHLNWMQDVVGRALSLTSDIFVTSAQARKQIERQVPRTVAVHQSVALIDAPLPLPASDAARDDVARQLLGRPVWLAVEVQPEEVQTVLLAHRRAGRFAHRLLLALRPAAGCETAQVIDALAEVGLRGDVWSEGALLDENLQVLVITNPNDLGLWYRLASTCFLASSLASGYGGLNPYQAATLGCAVLYGPNVGNHLQKYSALVEVGGARIVRDMDSLATALTTVLAPDKSAAMAHAGWELVTGSAQLVDSLVDIVQDCLDLAEVS